MDKSGGTHLHAGTDWRLDSEREQKKEIKIFSAGLNVLMKWQWQYLTFLSTTEITSRITVF